MRRIVVTGIAGLLVLGLALMFNQDLGEEAREAPAATVAAGPAAEPGPPSEAPVPAAPPAHEVPRPPAPPEAIRPTFDVVRVNRDGDVVMAGRAAPGAVVTVLDGSRIVGEATADARGEWVLLPSQPQPPGDRELSLSARLAGGEASESATVVVLSVPERDTRQRDGGGALVVAMPRDGAGPSRILQPRESAGALPDPASAAIAAEGARRLSVDTIDYDTLGKVALRGHATPGATVEIEVGGRRVGSAAADGGGNWVLSPSDELAAGPHNLTILELLSDGRVGVRMALPFYRAEGKDLPADAVVVVQPGASLWRIARRSYGSGVRFTEIYEANRSQIRDPDMIFPGQVFTLPNRVN